jgi:hypothetical protein
MLCELRPMKIADMFPGYSYEPGMSILHIRILPIFGEGRDTGLAYEVPVKLPAAHREPTEFNIRLALALVERVDPGAAAVIEEMKHLAREPHSRSLAAASGLFL